MYKVPRTLTFTSYIYHRRCWLFFVSMLTENFSLKFHVLDLHNMIIKNYLQLLSVLSNKFTKTKYFL